MIAICWLMNALYKIPEIDVPVNHKGKKTAPLLISLKSDHTNIHIKKKGRMIISAEGTTYADSVKLGIGQCVLTS